MNYFEKTRRKYAEVGASGSCEGRCRPICDHGFLWFTARGLLDRLDDSHEAGLRPPQTPPAGAVCLKRRCAHIPSELTAGVPILVAASPRWRTLSHFLDIGHKNDRTERKTPEDQKNPPHEAGDLVKL